MGINLQHVQWGIPTDAFPCWVISESDRINSLKKAKPFNNSKPPCFFKPTQRLDNNFIQGYLGNISQRKYHGSTLDGPSYLTNYENRQPVYFSFDRVTLYRLIETHPTAPLTLTLKRIDSPKTIIENRAFMIMPFKDEMLDGFYKNHIRSFLEKELQIQIFRADDFNGNDIIIETIYNQIELSEFIIADTSLPNKNAFYELGWASAKDKEIITMQDREVEQNVFFDRSHIRTLFYSRNNIPELQRQLKNDIIAIREKMSSKN